MCSRTLDIKQKKKRDRRKTEQCVGEFFHTVPSVINSEEQVSVRSECRKNMTWDWKSSTTLARGQSSVSFSGGQQLQVCWSLLCAQCGPRGALLLLNTAPMWTKGWMPFERVFVYSVWDFHDFLRRCMYRV